MWDLFKTIMKKSPNPSKLLGNEEYREPSKPDETETKAMFITALTELKYMGYLSQTRQSTYIFKKNFFGKVKHNKQTVKSEEQMQKEQEDIKRQFGNIKVWNINVLQFIQIKIQDHKIEINQQFKSFKK